jgi:bifunctional non-homologous end joining protein LigD
MATLTLDGHPIDLSNTDKVFFPDAGLTKGDLVDYYRRMADVMLPHLRDRLLTMHRFPDGIDGEGFYQRKVPDHFPGWIDRVTLETEGGASTHLVCNDAATLVVLANHGCITPHVWLSHTDALRTPDRLVVDLDPPGDDLDSFPQVQAAARALHDLLNNLGLAAFVTTSGSRGLHVVTPLRRESEFDVVRTFAQDLAAVLAAHHPDTLTTAQRKAEREGRVFLDVQRVAYAQSTMAPYAIRARPGAPVATPLTWDEVDDTDLSPRRYTMQNIFRRLGQKDDPWQDLPRHARSLDAPRQRLDALLAELDLPSG